MGFSYFLTSTDCLARIMLQQHRFCIYKGKINVKLPNVLNVLFAKYYTFAVFIFCLIWGPMPKTIFFPRFMTESSQSEILNNSMLKIQYKHESLIFFCSKKNKTIPFSQNIMQCSGTECLSIWSTFWIIHLSQFVKFTYAFFQFSGLLPYSQNTALKRKCKVSFVLCFVGLFGIMNQYDPTHDLKINVGHRDLYFIMVQWFYILKTIDVWTSLGITGQYVRTFDLKINVCHCDLYFMVHWFCLISQTIWWMSVIFSEN